MGGEEDGTPRGPIVENIDTDIGQQEGIAISFFLDLGRIAGSCSDIEILNVVVEDEIAQEEGFPLIIVEYGESASAFNHDTELVGDNKVIDTYPGTHVIPMASLGQDWFDISQSKKPFLSDLQFERAGFGHGTEIIGNDQSYGVDPGLFENILP